MLHCRISPSDDVYNCTQDSAQSKTIDFKSTTRISLPIFPTSFLTYNFFFSSQLLANFKVFLESIRSHNFLFFVFWYKVDCNSKFSFQVKHFFPSHAIASTLHQSQLDFLISFFGAKSLSVDRSLDCHQDTLFKIVPGAYNCKGGIASFLSGKSCWFCIMLDILCVLFVFWLVYLLFLLILSYVHNLCMRYLCNLLEKFNGKRNKTSAEYNLISHVVRIYSRRDGKPLYQFLSLLSFAFSFLYYDVAFQYIWFLSTLEHK